MSIINRLVDTFSTDAQKLAEVLRATERQLKAGTPKKFPGKSRIHISKRNFETGGVSREKAPPSR